MAAPVADGRLGQMANDALFTVGAEATNAITTAVQLKLGAEDITERCVVIAYLSSDANGDTPIAAQTSIACGTDGSVIGTLTAATSIMVISEADGDIDITVTDTGVYTRYLNIILPNGLKKSVAMTFA
jgi:hypothetical protein